MLLECIFCLFKQIKIVPSHISKCFIISEEIQIKGEVTHLISKVQFRFHFNPNFQNSKNIFIGSAKNEGQDIVSVIICNWLAIRLLLSTFLFLFSSSIEKLKTNFILKF